MSDAVRVIAALHAGADELDPLVAGLTADQLLAPSAATEWNLSQVISHLGSGAVITLAGLDAAVAGRPNPGIDANRAVWARWDAMRPDERPAEYAKANDALLARYDSLDEATRESFRSDLGFLPQPVDLATAGRFRLNEFTLHSWDIRVVFDPAAALQSQAVPLLLDQVSFMLGWLAKPQALGGRDVALAVTLHEPDRSFGLHLSASGCSIGDVPAAPDATLVAPGEAWLRLVGGRLTAGRTPSSVTVTGDVTLDTLRQVFPGF